jgi:hypothetical protein
MFGTAMGIISHCYYDNGVISKKFQFVLKYILGSRNLFRHQIKAQNAEMLSQLNLETRAEENTGGKGCGDSDGSQCGGSSKGESAKLIVTEEITENKVDVCENSAPEATEAI